MDRKRLIGGLAQSVSVFNQVDFFLLDSMMSRVYHDGKPEARYQKQQWQHSLAQ
jgi:hypothetical protein